MCSPERVSKVRGFSLIEMMAAIAVIGVGLTGVLWAINGTLSAQRRVEQRATANDLLRNLLTEYADADEPKDAIEGRFDVPFDGFQWRVEVTPTEMEGLYRLQARVSWEGRAGQRWIEGQTLTPQQ